MRKQELDTPVLCVDLECLDRNISRMAALTKEAGIRLRPHVKAHKSVIIAQKQVACGAVGVGVAKLGEAEVMALGGITDIMITTPLVGAMKVERLKRLARRIKVSVVLDSLEVAQMISAMARGEGLYLETLVEIDTGLHRCGVEPGSAAVDFVKQLLRLPNLPFGGLKTAELQVYRGRSPSDVQEIELKVSAQLVQTVEELVRQGIEVPNVCAGSTASAEIISQMPGITEVHPGSYVFNSLDGVATGAADLDDCALTVLTTVISRPTPDRAVIDSGFKTLSLVAVPGMPGYGHIRTFGAMAVLERLYEEHGVIQFDRAPEDVRIGDVLEIIPCSCSAVPNLFDEMVVVRGDDVVDVWPISARGRTH